MLAQVLAYAGALENRVCNMGPMGALLVWSLGFVGCWGMDGSVSSAAAASSGAAAVPLEPAAAPGRGP